MPENMSYRDDLESALAEASGARSEVEIAAEAFIRRMNDDARFRKAVQAALRGRKAATGGRNAESEGE